MVKGRWQSRLGTGRAIPTVPGLATKAELQGLGRGWGHGWGQHTDGERASLHGVPCGFGSVLSTATLHVPWLLT